MIVAIIPSYNPDKNFNNLLKLVKKNISHIIVVDDGSIKPIKINIKNVTILRNKTNKGKGYSLRRAFTYAEQHDFKSAITLDSDGQHDPIKIKNFILKDDNIDIVVGNRKISYPMPLLRRLSNLITSFILSIRTGIKILDSQSGYRKYNLTIFNKYNFNESGFHFESEVLIKVLSNGGTLSHISIPTIYNQSQSYINHFSDTVKFISLIIRSLFW